MRYIDTGCGDPIYHNRSKTETRPEALFLRICGLFCELHRLRVGVRDSYLLLSADISRSARGPEDGGVYNCGKY